MSPIRGIAAGTFAILVGIAAASVFLPGIVSSVVPAVLTPPGETRSDVARYLLPALGLGALTVAIYATLRLGSVSGSSTPLVEPGVESSVTGAVAPVERTFEHECTRAGIEWSRAGAEDEADEFLDRLRSVAAATYATETGVDRSTARDAVDRGTWTDDRGAAWFLARRDAAVSLPPLTWLHVRLRPRTAFHSLVDRTAAELDALRGDL